jgi:hypothetical protein
MTGFFLFVKVKKQQNTLWNAVFEAKLGQQIQFVPPGLQRIEQPSSNQA